MVRMRMIAMTVVSAGLVALGAGMRGIHPGFAVVAGEPPAIAEAPAGDALFARVVDMQGRPVPGQQVHVWGDSPERQTLKTDVEGRIRIPDNGVIGPRHLLLLAMPDEKRIGWASLGIAAEDLARGTADDPLTLTLEPRDSPVTGTVVDRAGRPIAGAEVHVEHLRDDTNGLFMGSGLTVPGWPIGAVTDDLGRYTIPLPRGTGGGMRARHRRYCGPWIGFKAEREPIGPTTLDPGGSIVGVVTDGATGRPLAGASVAAQTVEYRMKLDGDWGDATTDDLGRFEIGGLKSGVFNLLFLRGPEGRRTMTGAAVEGVRVRIDKDEKADLTAIEGRELRGSVIDAETKAPLPGVMVGYYGTARPRSSAAVLNTRTDAAGQFELSVPPGPAYVYIMDGSGAAHSSMADVVVPDDRDPEPVRLLGTAKEAVERPIAKAKVADTAKVADAPPQKAERKAIVKQEPLREPEEPLMPTTVLMGQVVDPAGHVIPGVRVDYMRRMDQPQGQFFQSVTDRDGEFIMEGLPVGPLKIHLSKDGYRDSTESVGALAVPERFILSPRPNKDRKPAPAPADLPKNLRFLDIQPKANEPLNQGPLPNGDDLAELPLGVRKLGGMWYSIGPMMIHLRASLQARLPKSAEGIKVGSRCDRLHFLHGTQYEVPDRTTIGRYKVHYADGFSEDVPIVYGEDVSVWTTWRGGPGKASHANLAWKGKNQRTELNPEAYVYLYDTVWTNPHPGRVIDSIDFESAVTDCSPFLVAVTAETK